MSKGSNRRPLQTSLKEFNRRWDKAFEKKDNKKKHLANPDAKTSKI